MKLKTYGEIETRVLDQINRCRPNNEYAALMGDNHVGYSMPIGGVVAYENLISPSGVGYDIACGNKAVLTNANANDVRKNIKQIMDEIYSEISFGVGRKNKTELDHELFNDPVWTHPFVNKLKRMAQQQLGTVGSGNHYVDIFVDELDRVWIGVHFGSRGLGHKIATYFVEKGQGHGNMDGPPVLFDVRSEIGHDYVECMNLAGQYAYAGRDYVCSEVAKILNSDIIDEVHNHHNFAWKENHFGTDLYVVRKGATPAFPGQRGFVGGSMGENSVILEGVDSEESKNSLYSTVHGAGRVMGRKEAAGSFRWKRVEEGKPKQLIQVREGKLKPEMMQEWLEKAGVELRGGGLDESPHCYKRLNEVLDLHQGTIKILHTLKPIGVAMAGNDSFDPYKD